MPGSLLFHVGSGTLLLNAFDSLVLTIVDFLEPIGVRFPKNFYKIFPGRGVCVEGEDPGRRCTRGPVKHTKCYRPSWLTQ